MPFASLVMTDNLSDGSYETIPLSRLLTPTLTELCITSDIFADFTVNASTEIFDFPGLDALKWLAEVPQSCGSEKHFKDFKVFDISSISYVDNFNTP